MPQLKKDTYTIHIKYAYTKVSHTHEKNLEDDSIRNSKIYIHLIFYTQIWEKVAC